MAAPICFVGTLVLLRLSTAQRQWSTLLHWIAAGAIAGTCLTVAAWYPLAAEPDDDWLAGAIMGAFGAYNGSVGGWLCRRFSKTALERIGSVDPDIFG